MSKITFSVEIKSRGITPILDRENKVTREMLEKINDAVSRVAYQYESANSSRTPELEFTINVKVE